jgi:hypothetical protein
LEAIAAAAESETGISFQVLQAEEKLRGLRFHVNHRSEAILPLISVAEVKFSQRV